MLLRRRSAAFGRAAVTGDPARRDPRVRDRRPLQRGGRRTADAQSADLMSYLLFDSAYTRALIDIGYQDAAARIDEIEGFLLDGNGERPEKSCPSTSP